MTLPSNELRSQDWYGGEGRDPYIHRAWMRRGIPADAFKGKRPQIAIANTAGDLVPCNMHLNEVAQYVKNGVYEAGGIPLEIPIMGLGETLVKPTESAGFCVFWVLHTCTSSGVLVVPSTATTMRLTRVPPPFGVTTRS